MFAVIFNNFILGINFGWLAPVLRNSENTTYEIVLTLDQRSWIASLHQLFALCGLIICLTGVDKFGRKKMISLCSLCYLLGWALIKFTKSVHTIYLSRIILGIQLGVAVSIGAIIVGESSLSNQRGIYTNIRQLFFSAGVITENVLMTYCSNDTAATINLAVGFLYLPSIFMLKETVPFLILKRRYAEAEENYRWLFSDDVNEFEKLRDLIEKSATHSLNTTEFFETPAFYKSIAFATSLTVLVTLTGYFAILSYSSTVFASSNLLSPNEFTICFGFIQGAGALGSSFFIDRCNRRTLLLSALAAAALTHFTTAGLYYTQENLTPIPHFPWLIFTSISLFSAISSIGMFPVITVLLSELFPQKIKQLGIALAGIANFLMAFLNAFMFLKISNAFGIFSNFLYFSAISIVALVFAYLFMPETRGKSLLEIERMFEKSNVPTYSYSSLARATS